MGPKWVPNGFQMGSKWFQMDSKWVPNGSKIGSKWFLIMGSKWVPNGFQMGPKWVPNGSLLWVPNGFQMGSNRARGKGVADYAPPVGGLGGVSAQEGAEQACQTGGRNLSMFGQRVAKMLAW
eukprot:3093448-Pyramimonas_sp.AAC.1